VSQRNLRLRKLLAEQFETVAVVLLVLALVGGAVTYTTHVSPATTTEERVVSTWESSGTFDHSATVMRENPLFPVDSRLERRNVYFSNIAPVLNGSYTFVYRASESGELETSIDVSLVTRSVTGGDGEEATLWETTRTLRETGTATVAPGTSTRVQFGFNTSDVAAERDRIEDRLGGTVGTTETVVRAVVDIEGTVNGQSVDTQQVHTLPVTLEGNIYRIGPTEPQTQQFDTTQTVTTSETYGPVRSVGGPALALVALVGLAGLAVGRSRGTLELGETERARLSYGREREEFDEWITTFELPEEALDRPRADAASLGDLVDLAIDTGSGVVTDTEESAYYVLHGEFIYVYTPPASPGTDGPDGVGDVGGGDGETDASDVTGGESDGRSGGRNEQD
jgi:hypothetical protein